MKRIQSFKLSTSSIQDLIAFCAEVEGFAKASLDPNMIDDFSQALLQLRMQWANATATLADRIDEADSATDQAWNAIFGQLSVNVNHYDETVRKAAQHTMKIFRLAGDPTRLPYNEEYAQLDQLIELFHVIPTETLKAAMVDGWFEELKKRIEIFKSLHSQSTKTNTDFESCKSAKMTLLNAYTTLISKVNIMMNNDDHSVVQFVDDMNEYINAHLLMHRMKVKIHPSV